jgi:hypothetical protein
MVSTLVGALILPSCMDANATNNEDVGMGSAAIALALLGFAIGLLFRLKVLLLFIAFLLVVSVIFSVAQDFTLLKAAMTIMAAQAILQSSYFLGLLTRAGFTAAHRPRSIL